MLDHRLFAALALSAAIGCATRSAGPRAPVAPIPEKVEPPAAPSAAPLKEPIRLAAVGDVMLGSTFPEDSPLPPDDARGLLAEAAPILRSADLAIGNLEGPMLEGGESTKCRRGSKNCYAFRVPTRFGERLKEAGFRVMGLANNHANDFGAEGLESSQRVLDALGIAHTGPLGDIARITIRGQKVAVVAFAPSSGMHDLNDLAEAGRLVAELKKESDHVVVTFHGGAEGPTQQHVPPGHEIFLGEDRGDLRAFARAVIDAGASAVIGHGPHVVRGLELYRGRIVAYSLGNFATWEKMNLAGPLGITLVLELVLNPDGTFAGGRIHPIKQVRPGGARLDPAGEVIPLVVRLSREDFGESALVPASDGTLVPPR